MRAPHPVKRKEGPEKLTGQATYIDDMKFPNMLYGTTVRSTIPRGRIKNISFDASIDWDAFTIVTADDVPASNQVEFILNDQPFLAQGEVNHAEEPIVLLAHPDKYVLEEAKKKVVIEYEELAPVLEIEESLEQKETIWGKDNIFKSYNVQKGDVDSQWEGAAVVVEETYTTGAQEQLYIENNGMIAQANPNEGVTVWGSMQCPYYVHKSLVPLFGLPPEKVRIVQAMTGGGFGGKEEYPTLIAGHAALLAWKSGKLVKLIYDRAEDMAATTKRHPSRTKIKSAFSAEGKLLATDIDFVIDGGAYATLSSVVLSRGTIHAAGPYSCDHVRISSRAVATNHPPHGAFRGFGAPQSIFGFERLWEKAALKLNISAEELRERNFVRKGDYLATKQEVKDDVRLQELLDRARKESNFETKRDSFKEHNKNNLVKKGIGLAAFMHGSGFTGSGEKVLASIVELETSLDGQVNVLASSTEIGQGTDTIFAQITARALNISEDLVSVQTPDTARVPNSGPTVASRTCMIVGKLIERAAHQLAQKLQEEELLGKDWTQDQWTTALANYHERFGILKVHVQYDHPTDIQWDDEKYEGDAYGAYAWAVYVAEVSVDTVTYEVQVDDFVALQEVGKVVHPVLAAGQIEGGVAQGIGYALYEDVVWKDGRMANNRMTNYIMPTSEDLPEIRVFFEEVPYHRGPFGGAKGIGELPMDGPAPAILNAIENAVGVHLTSVPATSEKVMQALEGMA